MKRYLILVFVLTASLAVAQSKPRQATIAQQKMCAEQARKVFHEDNPTRPPHMVVWEYTSHYEARTNVCYIMTHYVKVEDKSTSIQYSVYDAFEGRGYASFVQLLKYSGEPPADCEVIPHGQDTIWCKTADEFRHLVDNYFGIGR